MLPRNHPGRTRVSFDDLRRVANAGLIVPATLALRLGLPQLVQKHHDLGDAPGRANTGDKLMTLVASAPPLSRGQVNICTKSRWKADRAAELTATRAGAAAFSTPSIGLSKPK